MDAVTGEHMWAQGLHGVVTVAGQGGYQVSQEIMLSAGPHQGIWRSAPGWPRQDWAWHAWSETLEPE